VFELVDSGAGFVADDGARLTHARARGDAVCTTGKGQGIAGFGIGGVELVVPDGARHGFPDLDSERLPTFAEVAEGKRVGDDLAVAVVGVFADVDAEAAGGFEHHLVRHGHGGLGLCVGHSAASGDKKKRQAHRPL